MKIILRACSVVTLSIGSFLGYTALINNTSFLNGRDATMAVFFALAALFFQGVARDAESQAD